ncbi:MAG: hypothetical protein KGI27_00680 [Thaumarchaeota archaeon]|nr:hypothetical protein [Nitrososphaerota archaeon]
MVRIKRAFGSPFRMPNNAGVKVLLLAAQKDNKSYEIQITTNSTVKESWINGKNDSR